MISFTEWSAQYDAFKKVLRPIMTKDLPTEPGQLALENQALPALLAAAREHEAMGAYFERDFKDKKQTQMAQVTWAKKDSAGVADALKARSFAVFAAMRPQD